MTALSDMARDLELVIAELEETDMARVCNHFLWSLGRMTCAVFFITIMG